MKMTGIRLAILIPLGLLLAAISYWYGQPLAFSLYLRSADHIEFCESWEGESCINISDKDTLHRLKSTIFLRRKMPCACLHLYHADFYVWGRKTEISLCDHCFGMYHMPTEFYTLFLELTKEKFGAAKTPA
jgi:hypothetical protein